MRLRSRKMVVHRYDGARFDKHLREYIFTSPSLMGRKEKLCAKQFFDFALQSEIGFAACITIISK